MNRYIDIHTHQDYKNTSNVFAIKNILLPDQEIQNTVISSVGWHPWFIEKHPIREIKHLIQEKSKAKQVIAIGECGIDRAINTPLDIQKEVFKIHLEIAEQLSKPIIVHSVKAYSDILQALKASNFSQAIIFHDYRGNPQQTNELLKFKSYFSFGESILKNQSILVKFTAIPVNRLFFETDESSISIEKIYLRAAFLLNKSESEVCALILNNFNSVFGNELVE
jgi:TatD DNase family protein